MPLDLDLDDETYNSSEDEDFTLDPTAGEDDEIGLTSSDEELENEKNDASGTPAAKKPKTARTTKKRKTREDGAEGIAELDSGDEAMIQKAKARKKQKQQKGEKTQNNRDDNDEDDEEDMDFDDDDAEEGGRGGFVRTRAMRMRVQEESKPLAKIDGATIDVDAIWASMNAPESHIGLTSSQQAQQKKDEAETKDDIEMRDQQDNAIPPTNYHPSRKTNQSYVEEMIKIKRTYKFAGEMITEEKLVAKDSAEAKLYLANASGKDGEIEIVTATDADLEGNNGDVKVAVKLRRPLRRVSRFDPNPTGSIKKSWEKQAATAAGTDENASGPKINTVEKSRMDWAAYVDRAGIKDELRIHSKAKEGFLGRMDFLDRVDAKREEERRNARLKGM